MARWDEERGAVVARILYDGLGTAGKTSSLRKLRDIFSNRSGEIYVPEETRGRTLYFDWLELEAGRFDEHRLSVEVMTVPGQWAYAHRRWMLLASADALIAVVDSTAEGVMRAEYAMTFLGKALEGMRDPPPLIVQAHKRDLEGVLAVDDIRARLSISTTVVETSATTGEGLREAFLLALKSARARVRRALDGGPATTLPRAAESPEALFERMRELGLSGEELEGDRVLAAVLDEMDPAD